MEKQILLKKKRLQNKVIVRFVNKKMINLYMKKGKKSVAKKFFLNFFLFLKKNNSKLRNIKHVIKLIHANGPFLEVRVKRFGRNFKNIPFAINPSRSITSILKTLFFLLSLKKKKYIKLMYLEREFILCSKKKGSFYNFLKKEYKKPVVHRENFKFSW